MTAPTLCIITGELRDVAGRVRKGVPVVVRNRHDPMTAGAESWIDGGRVEFKSDREGIVRLQLIRGARVWVDFPGRPDVPLQRTVPDSATFDLVAWLFPYVLEVRYVGADIDLALGESLSLQFEADLSDGTTVPVEGRYLTLTSADEAVATLSCGAVVGAGPGSTTLSVSGIDQSFLETNQTLRGGTITHATLPAVEFPDPLGVSVS